jgi:hypothetical protein
MVDDIWYNDISKLFQIENLTNFFPNEDMSLEEKLNSALRFTIYFSILIFLIKKTFHVFYMVVIVAGITYIVYNMKTKENFFNDEEEEHVKKNKKNTKCTVPVKTNPFMNVLLNDYVHNAERSQACDLSDEKVEDKVKVYFENNLYTNIDDVYNRNSSYRQFYTTPNTTIPNDQEGFAKWLYYSEDKTCKEGNTQKCYR